MKSLAKLFVPKLVWREFRRLAHSRTTSKEAFEQVYLKGTWGKSDDASDPFYSGAGSHMPSIVPIYVDAVIDFLESLDSKPNVVDLGCGDFAIGSKIRGSCNQYIACDVVEALIARNRTKYGDLQVDFRTIDISDQSLPGGDIVFLRQVLQHLSNRQILAVVSKLRNSYKYLVLTEHLPSRSDFVPNLDKEVGAGIRIDINKKGSGVILTKPPFNLQVLRSSVLCEIPEGESVIRTNLYMLR